MFCLSFMTGESYDKIASIVDSIKRAPAGMKNEIIQRDLVPLLSKKEMPVMNGNRVLFIYYGAAKRVEISGDMTNWIGKMSMKRIKGTNLFYLKKEYERDARFDYKIIVDGRWILDPFNAKTIRGGFGENSYFEMPEYIRKNEAALANTALKGTIEKTNLGHDKHKITVYLPAGYDGKRNYPVVYFQDGDDYINNASALSIIDNAVAVGELDPFIAVFVNPVNRNIDYIYNDRYTDFFVKEVVPFVENKYMAIKSKEGRFIVGDSLGGLASFYILYKYPEMFGGVFSQSGALNFTYTKKVVFMNKKYQVKPFLKDITLMQLPVKMYLVVGTYEERVAGYFNFYKGNKEFHKRMLDNGTLKGIILKEYNQGHSWGLWRDTLSEGLAYLLGSE